MKNLIIERNIAVTVLVFLLVVTLAACGARKPASPEEAQADFQVENMPEWFLNPPDKKGSEHSAGYAYSVDLQLARDKASLHARRKLCDTIAGRLSGQQKLYRSEGGERLDQGIIESFEETIKSACYDVEIPGWKIADSRYKSHGKNIHAWILVEYPQKSVSSVSRQLRGSDAFEELEQDLQREREKASQ